VVPVMDEEQDQPSSVLDLTGFGQDRLDGAVMNELLKLGGEQDMDNHSRPGNFEAERLSPEELEDFFLVPIAERVCTLIPSLIKSGGFQVMAEDFGSSLADRKKKREFQSKMQTAIRQSRILPMMWEAVVQASIYNSGAAVILEVDDNPDRSLTARPNWDQPVNWSQIRSVKALFVLSGRDIRPETQRIDLGQPRLFRFSIQQPQHGIAAPPLDDADDPRSREERDRRLAAEAIAANGLSSIHEDRILWIEGGYTPPKARARYNGSIGRLQRFWPAYSRYAAALGAASNMLHRSELIEVAKEGWVDTLRAIGTAAGRQKLRDELNTMLYSLTNMGMVVRDKKKTEIKVIKRSVGGFGQMIGYFKQDMISQSGLTEMHLFGFTTVSGGLSGNDWRDRAHLELQCDIRRESEWREPIEKFMALLLNAESGPTKGKEPSGWRVEFRNTLTLTPVEEADMRSKQANTDKIYAELGLPQADILVNRFEGKFSTETVLLDMEGLVGKLEAAADAPPEGEMPPEEGASAESGEEEFPEGDLEEFEAELMAEFQLDAADDSDRRDEWEAMAEILRERGHDKAAAEALHQREALGLLEAMEGATRADRADAYQRLASVLYRRHPFMAGQLLGHAVAERAAAIRGDSESIPFSFGDRFGDEETMAIGEIEALITESLEREKLAQELKR
jgi:hypothetical protein